MKNNFSENLKCLRKETGLSQRDFAKAVGVGKSIISEWENEKVEPKLSGLILLADYLKISIDELVGRDAQILKPKK